MPAAQLSLLVKDGMGAGAQGRRGAGAQEMLAAAAQERESWLTRGQVRRLVPGGHARGGTHEVGARGT